VRIKVTKESTKETVAAPYSSSAHAMKEGVGRNSGSSCLGTQLLGLLSHSLRSPRPPKPGPSVAERKSIYAVLAARRPRILNRLFPLPASLHTGSSAGASTRDTP